MKTLAERISWVAVWFMFLFVWNNIMGQMLLGVENVPGWWVVLGVVPATFILITAFQKE